MSKITVIFLIVMVCLFALSGCSPATEPSSDNQQENVVDTDAQGQEKGDVSKSEGGLPEPPAFPE